MKFRTTRKAIVEGTNAKSLFRCGYCDLENLCWNHEPIAYTCGIYGWNFDVYSVHGLTITTGYRNMCGNQIPYEILRSYDRKAEKIRYDYSMPYEERQEKVEQLLTEFCSVLKGDKTICV